MMTVIGVCIGVALALLVIISSKLSTIIDMLKIISYNNR